MPMDQPLVYFTGKELHGSISGNKCIVEQYAFQPSLTLAQGTVVGVAPATGVADVQTLSMGSTPASGSIICNFKVPGSFAIFPVTINWNDTAAQVQAKLNTAYGLFITTAAVGTGAGTTSTTYGVTVTGGALSSASLVFTGSGIFSTMPIPAITLGTNTLMTSVPAAVVATLTHTTVGVQPNACMAYNSAVLAAPTTAATLADSATTSTFLAGVHQVTYTLVTAGGETTPAPMAEVVLTTLHSISVTSITGLNAAVTAVNFYVDGILAVVNTPSAGATGTVVISGYSASLTAAPPRTNTAFTLPNGSGCQTPIGVVCWPIVTDVNGRITGAAQSGQVGGGVVLSTTRLTAPVMIKGIINAADIVGLDANALLPGGKFVALNGNITTGYIEIL